jgi:hypothetical protein
MKVDETIESVGRVWRQITILITLHLVFLAWAIFSHLISVTSVANALSDAETLGVWPSLKTMHTSLKTIGLGLPAVAGISSVIYLVTFQRLSLILGRLPVFALTYSQPVLWRAGKCFDELRKLIHYFEGYTASPELEDLEVTLGLAIAQYNKEFKEHYDDQVESRLATATLWSVYHSGFALLVICSAPIIILFHPTYRSLLLPLGLLVCMLITRCCWEAQIEHVVLGRLRFALDCALISHVQIVREETIDRAKAGAAIDETSYERISVFSNAAIDNYLWNGLLGLIFQDTARETQAVSVLYDDMNLAVALMKPSPGPTYQNIWVLHYARLFLPLTQVGALPFIPSDYFRAWLHERLNHPSIGALLERVRHRPDTRFIDAVREERLREALKNDPRSLIEGWPEDRAKDFWTSGGSFSKWRKNRPKISKWRKNRPKIR